MLWQRERPVSRPLRPPVSCAPCSHVHGTREYRHHRADQHHPIRLLPFRDLFDLNAQTATTCMNVHRIPLGLSAMDRIQRSGRDPGSTTQRFRLNAAFISAYPKKAFRRVPLHEVHVDPSFAKSRTITVQAGFFNDRDLLWILHPDQQVRRSRIQKVNELAYGFRLSRRTHADPDLQFTRDLRVVVTIDRAEGRTAMLPRNGPRVIAYEFTSSCDCPINTV